MSKAIDKAAGVEFKSKPASGVGFMGPDGPGGYNVTKNQLERTGKSTGAAKQWSGWGTALKPANEPICLARKPLSEPTVAANVLKWGTGALNIEACRIGTDMVGWGGGAAGGNTWDESNCGLSKSGVPRPVEGRWPANVLFDEEAARQLDEQSGALSSGAMSGEFKGSGDSPCYGDRGMASREIAASNGGASRFFYCAKTSREERNVGMAGEAKRPLNWSSGTQNPGSFQAEGTDKTAQNFHPTVKPVDLMKWLVQLVAPPGGIVLDPFAGSGSTLLACAFLNVQSVGIEISAEYAEIARKRIRNELAQGKMF